MTTLNATSLSYELLAEIFDQDPLVKVIDGYMSGSYPKAEALYIYSRDGKIAGNPKVYEKWNEGLWRCTTLEEIHQIVQSIPRKKAQLVLAEWNRPVHEFASPTAENEVKFRCLEKTLWGNFLHEGNYQVTLGAHQEIKVWIRFWVTSFELRVSIKGRLCPEAISFHSWEREQARGSEIYYTVGKTHWGQNNSGFAEKYRQATRLIESLAQGDWSSIEALVQENRTHSYSPNHGGYQTRFWNAQIARPELAKATIQFPLELPVEFQKP